MVTPVIHKVVSGDTLFSLSKKYGLTVNELKEFNNLKTDTIKVGQVLKLARLTYAVVSGDTLYSLSKKYNTTVEILQSINGLKGTVIKVGQILKLPEKYGVYFILQDENGFVLKNFDYEVELSDGLIYKGVTDDNGSTSYIEHKQSVQVIDIRIFAELENECCAAHTLLVANDIPNPFRGVSDVPNSIMNEINQAISRSKNNKTRKLLVSWRGVLAKQRTQLLDSLHKRITLKRVLKTRDLHQDEINLIVKIFKNAIDTKLVKIHKGEYLAWVQGSSAMTPDGTIYFPEEVYVENFADTNSVRSSLTHLFIHEMARVWQHQLGYKNFDRGWDIAKQGGYIGGLAYNYSIVIAKRKDLSEFNMEQQASIIADYYMEKLYPKVGDWNTDVPLSENARILQDFDNKPKDVSLLPLQQSTNVWKTVFDLDNGIYEANDRV